MSAETLVRLADLADKLATEVPKVPCPCEVGAEPHVLVAVGLRTCVVQRVADNTEEARRLVSRREVFIARDLDWIRKTTHNSYDAEPGRTGMRIWRGLADAAEGHQPRPKDHIDLGVCACDPEMGADECMRAAPLGLVAHPGNASKYLKCRRFKREEDERHRREAIDRAAQERRPTPHRVDVPAGLGGQPPPALPAAMRQAPGTTATAPRVPADAQKPRREYRERTRPEGCLLGCRPWRADRYHKPGCPNRPAGLAKFDRLLPPTPRCPGCEEPGNLHGDLCPHRHGPVGRDTPRLELSPEERERMDELRRKARDGHAAVDDPRPRGKCVRCGATGRLDDKGQCQRHQQRPPRRAHVPALGDSPEARERGRASRPAREPEPREPVPAHVPRPGSPSAYVGLLDDLEHRILALTAALEVSEQKRKVAEEERDFITGRIERILVAGNGQQHQRRSTTPQQRRATPAAPDGEKAS